jgi:hypothetical protein
VDEAKSLIELSILDLKVRFDVLEGSIWTVFLLLTLIEGGLDCMLLLKLESLTIFRLIYLLGLLFLLLLRLVRYS